MWRLLSAMLMIFDDKADVHTCHIDTPKCIEHILPKYTKYHPVSFLLKEVYSVPLSSLYLEINK